MKNQRLAAISLLHLIRYVIWRRIPRSPPPEWVSLDVEFGCMQTDY